MTADKAFRPSPGLQALFLLLAAFVGIWSMLGTQPLFDLDEGAFSEATREMIASGNYLLPTLNDEPRYDKPILIYWLQAASVRAFGFNEFALRFPSALCATLWMLAVFRFARREFDDGGAALLAAGSVALSLMASIIGHAATADALLDLLLSLSLLTIYRWFEENRRSLLLRAWLWIGLGVLAKGPIALLLPLAVSLPYALWRGQLRRWLQASFDPVGWIIAAGVVLPWVLSSYRADGGEFLRHFLLDHNLGRYGHTLQGHGGQPWYYLVAIWLIVAPFTVHLVPALRAALHRRAALDVYLLIWFAVVFVLFSFSQTQLPHYLLYGATPLFVLFGRWHTRLPARFWSLSPALLLSALFLALPWLLPYVQVPESRPYERGILELARGSFNLHYTLITAAASAAIVVLLLIPRLPRAQALLFAALAMNVALWWAVVPVLAHAQQRPVREAALRAQALKLPVVSYRTWLPSFSVYRGAATPNRLPQPGELVFLRLDRVQDLEKELNGVQLIPEFRKGGVALFRIPGPPPNLSPAPSATPEPTEPPA